MLFDATPASALPSYARQTGQQCAACHNGFPELTPYGRLFKLNGYTFKRRQRRTCRRSRAWSSRPSPTPIRASRATRRIMAPTTMLDISTASLFYGGAIAPNLGAFAQVTYDDGPRQLHWDNTDIRYAKSHQPFRPRGGSRREPQQQPNRDRCLEHHAGVGLSLRKQPARLDAHGRDPHRRSSPSRLSASPLMLTSTGSTMPSSASTGPSSPRMETNLGASPFGPSIKGLAPYWRFAVEPQWGRNTWEFGTFGMAASLNPGAVHRLRHRPFRRCRTRYRVSVPRRPPQRLSDGKLDHRERHLHFDGGPVVAAGISDPTRTIICGP